LDKQAINKLFFKIGFKFNLHFFEVLQLGNLIIEEIELAVLGLQIQLQVQTGAGYVSMMQF